MITRIILIIVAAAGLAACGGAGEAADDERLEVVAGFYPLAYAAEQVGGDEVAVTNLTPPGAEPHDLELSPRDVQRVRSADVVLYLGRGFQPALEEAAAGAEGEALDLLEGLELRDDGDPHVWLDPLLYAEIAQRIADTIYGDARVLVHLLEELDAQYELELAGCERRELVTSHAAFGYLADRYGLEQIPIAGIAPEAEPAPRDLERVAALARERGATHVFFETLVSPRVAETVAREAGAETAVLDPLEGLTPEAEERGEDYFSIMRENLATLRPALGCP